MTPLFVCEDTTDTATDFEERAEHSMRPSAGVSLPSSCASSRTNLLYIEQGKRI